MRTSSDRPFFGFRFRLGLVLAMIAVIPAVGQAPSAPGAPPAQANDQPPASPPIPLPLQSSDPFSGSAMIDKLVPDTLRLSLLEVIDRGQKHNLGLLLSEEQTGTARAERRRSLSALLPNVTAHSS